LVASGTVNNILAAPETTLRELSIKVACVAANQMREDFALEFSGQIRTGAGLGYKKLRKSSAFNHCITPHWQYPIPSPSMQVLLECFELFF
jgi:hypothetical protein